MDTRRSDSALQAEATSNKLPDNGRMGRSDGALELDRRKSDSQKAEAFNLPLSPDSAPNIDVNLVSSEKNQAVPAEQTPLKQMEMNSQEYHDYMRPLIAEANLAAAKYRAERDKVKHTGSNPQNNSSDED